MPEGRESRGWKVIRAKHARSWPNMNTESCKQKAFYFHQAWHSGQKN